MLGKESTGTANARWGQLTNAVAKRTVGYGLTSLAMVGLGFFIWHYYDRYVQTRTLILVAGKESGESFQLSKALEQVVKDNQCLGNIFRKSCYNFQIKVIDTQGTDENLEVLAGRLDQPKVQAATVNKIRAEKADHADLATAQADIVTDRVAQSSSLEKPTNSAANLAQTSEAAAQTVATLYLDTAQLVVKKSLLTNGQNFQFSKLEGKIIDVPLFGGQQTTFLAIAKHHNQRPSYFIEPSVQSSNFCDNKASALFRVRALGNSDIQAALQCDGELVSITQAAAMKIKHPAFQEKTTVPEGTYPGKKSRQPPKDIETIGIKRLLLARNDVPKEIIQEIAQILNERRQELAKNISQQKLVSSGNQATDNQQEQKQVLKSLVTQIREPNPDERGTSESAGVSLHEGARNFYRRNEPPFIIQYLTHTSAFLSIVSAIGAFLWNTRQHLKKRSKDLADNYIESAVKLMSQNPHGSKPKKPNPHQTTPELATLVTSYDLLEKIFQQASKSLQEEEISQESFRTFNEAYKTAREFIERSIEKVQRERSEIHIEKSMVLLDDENTPKAELLQQLSQILIEAKTELTQKYMFSRESFRTFIETYAVVRDALDRRPN